MLRSSLLFLRQRKRQLSSLSKYRGLLGGQIVYDKLKQHGVDTAFLYSGGAIMPLVDAFYQGDIRYYTNTHEQSGGHAATAYAKASGKTGISIVTSGPALTNSITPITDATADSIPLIVISGQVPLKSMGTNAFQECPSVDLTSPVTKWSYCVKDVHEIPAVMDEAFRVANEGKKGSVHIDLPKCVSMSPFTADTADIADIADTTTDDAENTVLDTFHVKETKRQKRLTKNEKDRVVNLLTKAERPIIILGKGVNPYAEEIRYLVETTKIPVTTTIHAMGAVDEMSPHSLQFMGMHGNAAANYAVQRSDMILAIGTRFDDRITGKIDSFAPHARTEQAPGIIHVNICENELNFVLRTPCNFAMDAGDFLQSLNPYLKTSGNPSGIMISEAWSDEVQDLRSRHEFTYVKTQDLKTQDVCVALNTQLQQLCGEKCNENENENENGEKNGESPYIVTTGVGNHQMMASQFIKWRYPNSFITSGSLGVMGTGVPFAIGAQLAQPNKFVLNIDGDGSFHHTLAELKTIRDYNLPIKIAIMNDGEMSMVKVWETLFFDGRHTATSLNVNPNYALLAEAFDVKGMCCDSKQTLSKVVEDFFAYEGAVVCDFRVKSDMCLPLVSPGSALDNMIFHDKDNLKKENDSSNLPPG